MASYILHPTFSLPAGYEKCVLDELPDGRLLIWNEKTVALERVLLSRRFDPIGELETQYPSFIRVSPDGTRAASGDGNKVTVFEITDLSSRFEIDVPNYDAEWMSNDTLAVSSMTKGESIVSVVDLTRRLATPVVRNVGDGSGGVTIDTALNLYCGDGYEKTDTKLTGLVKVFSRPQWQKALESGTPMDFKIEGGTVADLLSAGYLGFDRSGNLHVGGGQFESTDPAVIGYAAVVSRDAVAAVLSGANPVTAGSSSRDVLELDPEPRGRYWHISSNWVTGELYLTPNEELSVYVYRPLAGLAQTG